jgi:hypothetical protein
MPITCFVRAESSGYMWCDRRSVARRQVEMSIGLIVILLIVIFVAAVAVPLRNVRAPQLMTKTAPVAASINREAAVQSAVRVIPIYSSQTLSQTQSSRRS